MKSRVTFKRILVIILFTVFIQSSHLLAQQKEEILNNTTIIELTKNNVNSAVILAKIRSTKGNYDTTTEGIKQLKESKVADEVVMAMMETKNKNNSNGPGFFSGNSEVTYKKTKYGIGFQSSFPSYGISGKMNLSEKSTIQVILGFLGETQTYAGRYIYNFKRNPVWNAYGYGMVGAWNFDDETVPGFGVGGGFEYNLQGWLNDFPLWWNMELGLGYANFEYYKLSAVTWGAGVHYKF